LNQSDARIQCPSTNQKAGYKKKQPITAIVITDFSYINPWLIPSSFLVRPWLCSPARNEDPCRLLQHDWNDVFSTVTRRPWIWTCTSSTSATSTIWRSTATVSCVRNVIDYGRPELHRHERTCTGDDIYKYPGGVYQQKIGITLTELPITLRWCYSLQTRDDPRSSSPVFSRIRVARSVVFCSVL
jgi:hypothetical protein